MKISKFLEDLAIISKLGDNPGADNQLTSNGLKSKFDEGVLKLQQFINNEIVDKINSIFALDAPMQAGANMTGPINMNGLAIQNVAEPVEDGDAASKGFVNAAVRKAAPYNLLDNSDFRNPVNQRGQTNYSLGERGGYCIDRWTAGGVGATLSLNSNGVYLTGYLYQVIPNPEELVGKKVTLACKTNGKIYCVSGTVQLPGTWSRIAYSVFEDVTIEVSTQDNCELWAAVESTTNSLVEWVAFYEGEYTAETLPEYQPKGYNDEFIECRRYYRRYTSWTSIGSGYVAWDSSASIVIPHEMPMRITPSLVGSIDGTLIVNGEWLPFSKTPIAIANHYHCIIIRFANDSVSSTHKNNSFVFDTVGNEFALSADL